jgi:lysozyme
MKKMRPMHKGVLSAGTIAAVVAITAPFAEKFEGYFPRVYRDPVGVETYCFGETAADGPIDRSATYTLAQCQARLREKLVKYVVAVAACIEQSALDKLSIEELAAYGDFAYNLGPGAFCNGSVARLVNEGKRREACEFVVNYNHAGGRVFPGLTRRRIAERDDLCLDGLRAGTPQ